MIAPARRAVAEVAHKNFVGGRDGERAAQLFTSQGGSGKSLARKNSGLNSFDW